MAVFALRVWRGIFSLGRIGVLSMRTILLGLFLCSVAFAQVPAVSVEPSKKTTKTSQSGGSFARTIDYVDRVTLKITVQGEGMAEVKAFFVARDARTQALSYHGHEVKTAEFNARSKFVTIESGPAAYSESKSSDSSRETRRGAYPFGWVVVVRLGDREAIKGSSDVVLQWVQKNPPAKRIYSAP